MADSHGILAARKQRASGPRRGKDMLYSGKVLLKVTAAAAAAPPGTPYRRRFQDSRRNERCSSPLKILRATNRSEHSSTLIRMLPTWRLRLRFSMEGFAHWEDPEGLAQPFREPALSEGAHMLAKARHYVRKSGQGRRDRKARVIWGARRRMGDCRVKESRIVKSAPVVSFACTTRPAETRSRTLVRTA